MSLLEVVLPMVQYLECILNRALVDEGSLDSLRPNRYPKYLSTVRTKALGMAAGW